MPSLLTYSRSHFNLGDYIQSLAARQFLSSVDHLISREQLGAYRGPPTKLILNGWFTHEPDNWSPSSAITPLLVSFHLTPSAAPQLLSGTNLDFFRRHAPIGCRDHATVRLFQAAGIPAEFTGCLTLTLCRPDNLTPSDEIILNDLPSPLPPSLTSLLSPLLTPASRHLAIKPVSQRTSPTWLRLAPDFLRFRAAESLLRRLAAARLVITTRLHTALPCLAMGTPVLLIRADHHPTQSSRFDGLQDLLNILTLNPDGSLSSSFPLPPSGRLDLSSLPPNPSHFLPLASSLRSRCAEFLRNDSR